MLIQRMLAFYANWKVATSPAFRFTNAFSDAFSMIFPKIWKWFPLLFNGIFPRLGLVTSVPQKKQVTCRSFYSLFLCRHLLVLIQVCFYHTLTWCFVSFCQLFKLLRWLLFRILFRSRIPYRVLHQNQGPTPSVLERKSLLTSVEPSLSVVFPTTSRRARFSCPAFRAFSQFSLVFCSIISKSLSMFDSNLFVGCTLSMVILQ